MKTLAFTFSGYTGWDCLLGLLPKRWQAKAVAKAWIKNLGFLKEIPPNTTMTLNMPFGSFRILDSKGRLEPCRPEYTPGR